MGVQDELNSRRAAADARGRSATTAKAGVRAMYESGFDYKFVPLVAPPPHLAACVAEAASMRLPRTACYVGVPNGHESACVAKTGYQRSLFGKHEVYGKRFKEVTNSSCIVVKLPCTSAYRDGRYLEVEGFGAVKDRPSASQTSWNPVMLIVSATQVAYAWGYHLTFSGWQEFEPLGLTPERLQEGILVNLLADMGG